MNFLKFCITLSFVCFAIITHANTVFIKGVVREHITYKPIPFVSILVMDKDSIVLTSGMSDGDEGLNPYQFSINNVPLRDSYILRFSNVGHETTFVPLKLKKNQTFVDMGNVIMKRSVNQLTEVVVNATKIKMVVDKDTVIYNADAFQLSEGSMLDNLIKQLPGVELNEDGQILVNGRFISSLLLNGKDFFKGDPKVALENLPAYMVNKVKVYEKEREDAYLTKNKVDMDKELVMDVNLKKQYSIGLLPMLRPATDLRNVIWADCLAFALQTTPV
ncbi:MAG: carboxypeptidase-like regulatory domain-containing protein [Bacteroidales bacterium]|nr:carboxypeptidase-like regulatory domain-containing protein [Bacteroidales bacterium]